MHVCKEGQAAATHSHLHGVTLLCHFDESSLKHGYLPTQLPLCLSLVLGHITSSSSIRKSMDMHGHQHHHNTRLTHQQLEYRQPPTPRKAPAPWVLGFRVIVNTDIGKQECSSMDGDGIHIAGHG